MRRSGGSLSRMDPAVVLAELSEGRHVLSGNGHGPWAQCGRQGQGQRKDGGESLPQEASLTAARQSSHRPSSRR